MSSYLYGTSESHRTGHSTAQSCHSGHRVAKQCAAHGFTADTERGFQSEKVSLAPFLSEVLVPEGAICGVRLSFLVLFVGWHRHRLCSSVVVTARIRRCLMGEERSDTGMSPAGRLGTQGRRS